MEAATVPWVAGLPAKLWDGKSCNHRSELRHQLNIVTAGQLLCTPKPCGQAIFNKRQEEGRVGSCQKTQTGSLWGICLWQRHRRSLFSEEKQHGPQGPPACLGN